MSTPINNHPAPFVKRDKSALFAKLDEIERLANSITGPQGGSETEPDPKRHAALTRGNARDMREAAAALDALDAGGPPESVEIPPGVIINPTLEQIAEQCRPLAIEPPTVMPKVGWRGPIFAAAFHLPPPEDEISEEPFVA